MIEPARNQMPMFERFRSRPAIAPDMNVWAKVEFTVTLEPRQQDRPRDRIVTTKDGRQFISKYKSKKQQVYELQLGAFLSQQRLSSGPIRGPVFLDIVVYREVPSGKPKWFHAAAERGEEFPETKPDVSNILKNFEDVANKLLIEDDARIVDVRIGKRFGSPARWEITLWYRKDRQ